MVVAPRYADYAEGWETGVRRQIRVFNSDQEVVAASICLPDTSVCYGYLTGILSCRGCATFTLDSSVSAFPALYSACQPRALQPNSSTGRHAMAS